MSVLSVVIPVYNEKETLAELVRRVEAVPLINDMGKQIILVDDGSTDGTRELLEQWKQEEDYTIVLHERNKGKGAAIRSGLPKVAGEYVIIQDADLEYDPQDYNAMLSKMIAEDVPVVYGSRQLKKQDNRYARFSFYAGGLLLTFITNVLYRQKITDEPTCYKLFKTELIQNMPLECERFEFCPEVTARIARKGIKITEVPISYFPRDMHEGKKINWRDGWEAIVTLFKYRFKKL